MFLRNVLGCLLFLFTLLGNSWIVPADSPIKILLAMPEWLKNDTTSLFARQDGGVCSNYDLDPDTPLCSAICAPSSFSCSKTPLGRRDIRAEIRRNGKWRAIGGANDTEGGSLEKRVLNVLTQNQINTYVPNIVISGSNDPTFGTMLPLVDDPEDPTTDTVTVQQPFTNAAFQVGAGPLVGCTVVIIASNRAVHAGHYWEDPGWSSNSPTVFQQNVLNWFNGNGNGNQVGQGPALNVNLFNQAGDNTRVFIMVPRSDRPPDDYTSVQYRKVSQLISTLQTALPNANFLRWNYARVQVPAEPEGIQGNALFQFDPNGFGTNQLEWRVFLEQNVFRSDDEPYPASAVNGVPSYNQQGAG